MMKRITALLLISLLLLPSALGENAKIVLDANPTTGYEWMGFILGGDSAELEDEKGVYTPIKTDALLAGSGGTTEFTLIPKQSGESIVLFSYMRSWEHEPIDQRVYLADVDDELKLTVRDVTEEGVFTGIVISVNEKERSVLIETEKQGEIIATFSEADALPVVNESVTLYTNGVMTLSLPPVVNVIAWKSNTDELARDGEPSFDRLTGRDKFLAKITENDPVTEIYFTEGYGFSTAEFTVTDSDTIRQLINAVSWLEIESVSDTDITDWYPYLRFTMKDGTVWSLRFDGHMLDMGRELYHLSGDDVLWNVIKELEKTVTE